MGRALSPRDAPAWPLSLWHETAGDDWTPRAVAARRPRRRRRRGRRRAHRAVDRLLPAARGRPDAAGRGARGRDRRASARPGRNGGWCSALFPASLGRRWPRCPARPRRPRWPSTRRCAPPSTRCSRVAAAEGIDAQCAQGRHRRAGPHARPAGAGPATRSPHARAWGRGEDDVRLLDAARGPGACSPRTGTRRRAPTPRTARRSTPPGWCAGWPAPSSGAAAGSTSAPGCTRDRAGPGASPTTAPCAPRSWSGPPRATPRTLAGQRRDVVPVYSLIIATEPLPAATSGSGSGCGDRETFTDHRHLIIYGQRTADDRLVFGGRGAPYHFGSADPAGLRPRRRGSSPRCAPPCVDLFPVLAARPVHARLGRRARHPARLVASVGLDRDTGLAWAGGYVGDGVAHDEPGRPDPARPGARPRHRADPAAVGGPPLPRAGSRSRCAGWASNAGLRAMTLADAEERLTGRPSLVARAVAPLLGGH